jgi:hypothetical protein
VRAILAEERGRIERRLRWLAWAMDSAFEVPGTRWRIGWDAIIGLAPGVGDAVTSAVSLYIVYEAARLGVPKWTLARMLANVGIDFVLGSLPLVGDVFDAAWKANQKNLRLMGITPQGPGAPGRKYVRNEAGE